MESRSVIGSRSEGAIALEVAGESAAGTGTNAITSAHWLLRVACAWCFIGHGAWGIYQKPGWLPFYQALGIPDRLAWPTMPVVGAIDIAMGLLVLVHPCRAALVWMSFWCLFTALLRPLAGMGWWELLERGGNYAPPLALLVLAAAQPGVGWFDRVEVSRELPARIASAARWTLRIGIASLLIGHGGFAAFEVRSMLLDHWASIGLDLSTTTLRAIGWMEIAAGMAVLGALSVPLLIAVAGWKVATELLYPISGGAMDTFEWVERGGDYFAPLALIALMSIKPSGALPRSAPARSSPRGVRRPS